MVEGVVERDWRMRGLWMGVHEWMDGSAGSVSASAEGGGWVGAAGVLSTAD